MNRYTIFHYGSVLAVLMVLSSGCSATRIAEERAQKALQENSVLRQENSRLSSELEKKNALAATLQMKLVEKREEMTQMSFARQGLAKEIANNTIRTPAASTRVETVAYLAEVATEIASAREESGPQAAEVFEQVEKLMQESNLELEQNRFEQASLLAAQAMEMVNMRQYPNAPPVEKEHNVTYEEFLAPLEFNLAKRSNIRSKATRLSRRVTVADSGTPVVAYGNAGCWVKVTLRDGRKGWVHYSLLSVLQPQPEKKAKE